MRIERNDAPTDFGSGSGRAALADGQGHGDTSVRTPETAPPIGFVSHSRTKTPLPVAPGASTKTETSVRPIPVPAYLIPELKRWKLACPVTARGLVFPGEPNAAGDRNPIAADILLRHILRRALRRAGLPPLRFHDLRHMAGTLMHEGGVPLKRAQEILGHASERTTLAIYTHSMRRTHDDSADKIAALAGLSAPLPGKHSGAPGRNRIHGEKSGN
jgi:hypothetical protein